MLTYARYLDSLSSIGKPIRTGLSTETIALDSLDDLSIPLRGPACMKIHKWQRKDALISDEINGRQVDV
jgi:hypothetical protein